MTESEGTIKFGWCTCVDHVFAEAVKKGHANVVELVIDQAQGTSTPKPDRGDCHYRLHTYIAAFTLMYIYTHDVHSIASKLFISVHKYHTTGIHT